jgi:hypothetical protein
MPVAFILQITQYVLQHEPLADKHTFLCIFVLGCMSVTQDNRVNCKEDNPPRARGMALPITVPQFSAILPQLVTDVMLFLYLVKHRAMKTYGGVAVQLAF